MWRVAKSLLKLRDQVNEQWPKRSKLDDGTIGDASHAARASDHNPDEEGIVRAMDLTHDPAHGFNSYDFAEHLRKAGDKRIAYVISNRRIFSSSIHAWEWRPYYGSNPHDHHVHISVSHRDQLADDPSAWNISIITPPAVPSAYPLSGKGSWFSQYNGKYRWVDTGDKPNSNALGVPDSAQGIAFYNHDTLGRWFEVQAPNGVVSIEQQTDIGPAPWTGRKIDISAAAAERFGYSPNSFPTNGVFKWKPVDPPAEVKNTLPPRQATIYRDTRKRV